MTDTFSPTEYTVFKAVYDLTNKTGPNGEGEQTTPSGGYKTVDLWGYYAEDVVAELNGTVDLDAVENAFIEWDNERRFGFVEDMGPLMYTVVDRKALRETLKDSKPVTKREPTGTHQPKRSTTVVTKVAYTAAEAEAEKARIRTLAEQEGWHNRKTAAFIANVSRRIKSGEAA